MKAPLYQPKRLLRQAREGPDAAPGAAEPTAGETPPAKKRRGVWGDVLFYAALAALVLAVFVLKSSGGDAPTTFMGFAAMRVLTGSMEDVIPQGSLIITRAVDPDTLEVGDDITYLSGPSTTITHRIVGVTERYADTGQRAFTTQGVMNSEPDRLLVPAANVVGKVIFHSLALGKLLAFIQSFWMWLLILAGLFIALGFTLKIAIGETRRDRAGKRELAAEPPKGRRRNETFDEKDP